MVFINIIVIEFVIANFTTTKIENAYIYEIAILIIGETNKILKIKINS
jgi:hypothetical protein